MVELARFGTSPASSCRRRASSSPARADVGEVIAGSVLEMPFAEGSFDLAVSLDVIEHLEDDLAALRELRRTVAPAVRCC